MTQVVAIVTSDAMIFAADTSTWAVPVAFDAAGTLVRVAGAESQRQRKPKVFDIGGRYAVLSAGSSPLDVDVPLTIAGLHPAPDTAAMADRLLACFGSFLPRAEMCLVVGGYENGTAVLLRVLVAENRVEPANRPIACDGKIGDPTRLKGYADSAVDSPTDGSGNDSEGLRGGGVASPPCHSPLDAHGSRADWKQMKTYPTPLPVHGLLLHTVSR